MPKGKNKPKPSISRKITGRDQMRKSKKPKFLRRPDTETEPDYEKIENNYYKSKDNK